MPFKIWPLLTIEYLLCQVSFEYAQKGKIHDLTKMFN